MTPFRPRPAPVLGRVAASLIVLTACGGQQPEPAAEPASQTDSVIVAATPEEVQAELEILGYEITDLEAWIAARPPGASVSGGDPAALLGQAARARAAAEQLAANGDHVTAAESLSAAMRHVEQVKRSLGLAEELGEEIVD